MRKPKNAKVFCPVNGWDCPYWNENGTCSLENNFDCDDFATFWDEGDVYWDDETN